VSGGVIYKLMKGSQNQFALTLMSFTLLYAFYNIFGIFVVQGLPTYSPVTTYTANYFWYLLYLQSWIFAMKYLTSAVKSMSKMYFSYQAVNTLKWIGIGLYVFTMVTMYLKDVCSYPGLDDLNAYILWSSTTASTILRATHWIWLLLNIINTFVTLTSIVILFRQISKLSMNSESIKFNHWSMIIHIVLLLFQLFCVSTYVAPNKWFKNPKMYNAATFMVLLSNFLVQLIISFICYQQALI
jgi:hypothetical protein